MTILLKTGFVLSFCQKPCQRNTVDLTVFEIWLHLNATDIKSGFYYYNSNLSFS